MDTQQTFNPRLTHAWGALLKQYLIKSERLWSVHWHTSNVRQTRSKHIQCACKSMFKNFLSQTRTKRAMILATYSDARRTYTKHTQHTRNVFRTCLRRVSGVCGILQFFNTPGARFTYMLMCDCCLSSKPVIR